jgi:hypothetical protein
MTERAFFRSDLRVGFREQGKQVTTTVGFGVDF